MKRLLTTYKLQLSKDVIASVFMSQPKLPVLLSRASFRPSDVRAKERIRIQRERRNFLRGIFGIALLSVSALVLMKIASVSSSEPQTPINVSSVGTQTQTLTSVSNNPSTQTGRLLANASSIPSNQSLTFNDPLFGPIILVHLDNGHFVAYSSICTHAGCQVQFDPSMKDIICPCHGAVFDPYNSAQVLGGPAPYSLQEIPIQYDPSTRNIYFAG